MAQPTRRAQLMESVLTLPPLPRSLLPWDKMVVWSAMILLDGFPANSADDGMSKLVLTQNMEKLIPIAAQFSVEFAQKTLRIQPTQTLQLRPTLPLKQMRQLKPTLPLTPMHQPIQNP